MPCRLTQWIALCISTWALSCSAQGIADTVLMGGQVLQHDSAPAQAIAITGERIASVGSNEQIQTWVGPNTRVVPLAGRTVIPGLIDSHIHAIRAGLTEMTEVSWIGITSIEEGLERLREAAHHQAAGTWLVVAGGWTPAQLRDKRRPSQQDLAKVSTTHPIYLQWAYSGVLLSPLGLEKSGLLQQADLASRLTPEKDTQGHDTGWLLGSARTVSDVYNLLPRPSRQAQEQGVQRFFQKLNSLGVTGVIDPGGYNLPMDAYEPLQTVWRTQGLTVRVAFSMSAPRRGHELEDFSALTALLPMGLGDAMLKFNGLGENVTWGMYNNEKPTAQDEAVLKQVLLWAAARGLGVTFHWNTEENVAHLLRVLEAVHAQTPLHGLRWSIAHLNNASAATLSRMKAMNIGWLVQNASYYQYAQFEQKYGAAAAQQMPPIATALALGLRVGAGTDAHRVMSYNPFEALQWLVDGRSVDGQSTRQGHQLLSRMQALSLYTRGSAWFSHDEHQRGELKPGYLADLAVLDQNYLSMPESEIHQLRSLLTMVGGKVVHTAAPYTTMPRAPARP
jgi:predicted amidohydrolase YtcJ